jgi:hypothetical protein
MCSFEANGLWSTTLNSAPTEVDVTTVEMLEEGSSMGLVPDTLSDLKK